MAAVLRALICVAAIGSPAAAAAQGVPSEPVSVLGGRLVFSGEAAITFGTPDHESYFNYTDYERNALRNLRLSLAGIWQPSDRLAFVGEFRSEDFETAGAYAAYVRLRPWRNRSFDIQAGRIPPVFGAFGRRSYNSDRNLIGYPLAYQYLTSLRPDSVPATADDLLAMRGRGWKSSFPVGSQAAAAGVPLVSAFRWDTGVQARWSGALARRGVRGHSRNVVAPARRRRQRFEAGIGADRREASRRFRRRDFWSTRRLGLPERATAGGYFARTSCPDLLWR